MKQIILIMVFTFSCFLISGCQSEDAKYQPKPEDIPKIPADSRSGSPSDFLPADE